MANFKQRRGVFSSVVCEKAADPLLRMVTFHSEDCGRPLCSLPTLKGRPRGRPVP